MYLKDSEFFPASPVAAPSPPAERWEARDFSSFELGCKRVVDVVGALTCMVLFLPIYVAVGLGVRLTSPGPVLFSQQRVGRGGRLFDFYKFRSMRCNPDEVLTSFFDGNEEAKTIWDTYQKLEDDPRITRFGKVIRKLSLDELPQLWNVLKGDMSLVGPRPCLPEQEGFYGDHWSAFCSMKPGITGLWQVSGRNHLPYQERVRMDGHYVNEWSLWLDAKILLKTVRVVLTCDGSA